jgi:hypothetical protein
VGVRIEVTEKPVDRIVERVRVQTTTAAPTPADAAAIVLRSPRACRTVLEALASDAAAGRLDAGAHAPTLRAATALLRALRRARLIAE